MKKWMAPLLACLLCLCAVGAMAEKVSLDLSKGFIDLYPNGYIWGSKSFQPSNAATTQYVITGVVSGNTPLDIHLVPQGQDSATENVVYNISFEGVQINADSYCTAIRIGDGESNIEKHNGHTLTINLSNRGDNEVKARNHPAISDVEYPVIVNIHNQTGSLILADVCDEYFREGAFGRNVTLNVAGSPMADDDLDGLDISNTGESLTHIQGREPSYSTDGNLEHWICNKCHMYFLDADAKLVTTPDAVILPRLVSIDDLPQTGDTSRPAAWLALLGACCAGLWCLNRRRG